MPVPVCHHVREEHQMRGPTAVAVLALLAAIVVAFGAQVLRAG